MSFLASIFNPATGTPANGAGAPAAPVAAAAPVVAPVTPVEPAAPVSPLDAFSKLWETPKNADGTPKQFLISMQKLFLSPLQRWISPVLLHQKLLQKLLVEMPMLSQRH
jgi:hypothetical protein